MPTPCVYILASRRNGTRYVGVSWDLARRVWEHKQHLVAGFTKRYRVHTLVWFEVHASMASALMREKAIKAWRRAWKLARIEAGNLEWRDLYEGLIQWGERSRCLRDGPRRAPGWAVGRVGWAVGGYGSRQRQGIDQPFCHAVRSRPPTGSPRARSAG
jgi:putative endonuclease